MTVVVTLDGPAGAGKSTVAKQVARIKGWFFLDTGAMYRAVALKALRKRLGVTEEDKLAEMIRGSKLEFVDNKVVLDGEEITEAIRMPPVTDISSKIAVLKKVRDELGALQRKQREGRAGLVTEGRDQGTVVFPDADFKVYVYASVDVRARRRYDEMRAQGMNVDLAAVKKEIVARDHRDETREIAPLRRPAPPYLDLDTSTLTVDRAIQKILEYIG